MGQKINPISLRININRNFDSCWYEDNPTKYSKLLHQDLSMRSYLKSLFNSIGVHTGRITFQFFQKKLIIHYIFYDAHKPVRGRSGTIQKKSTSGVGRLCPKVTLSPISHMTPSFKHLLQLEKANHHFRYIENYLSYILQNERLAQNLNKKIFLKSFLTHYFFSQNQSTFSTKQFNNYLYDFLFVLNSVTSKVVSSKVQTRVLTEGGVNEAPDFLTSNQNVHKKRIELSRFSIDKNLSNIEYILSKKNQINTMILPMKMRSRFQSASFICEYVCQKLQENITFRQIFKQLSQEMVASGHSQGNHYISGMRILCSGRLNGVEMARVESKKLGQTSLHVFSSKIDYAVSEAYTLYGLLGVKVWLCFSSIKTERSV